MPGNLAQVSAGSLSNAWGVTGAGTVFQWNGTAWSQVATTFAAPARQVAVAQDGTVWAVDQNTNLYTYNGTAWTLRTGSLNQLSVASVNNAWGVNSGSLIWQWNGAQWNQIAPSPNATARQVSVSADGTAYLLDAAGTPYVRNGASWQQLPGNLAQLSSGLSDRFLHSDLSVTKTGTWTVQADPKAYARGYLRSSKAGDTVTFKFSGDSVTLYRLMDPSGGQATVTLDGVAKGNLEFYFPQRQAWQVPAVFDGLGAGPHTLVLTVSADKHDDSTGTNVYVDTFGAPAPFLPNPNQTACLATVNQIRGQAGLPVAALSMPLNLAAQGHADYLATNGAGGHNETAGLPGFIGITPGSRASYFGYFGGAAEVANPGGDSSSAINNLWMASVYHRTPFFRYDATDVGCGSSAIGANGGGAVKLGSQRGTLPAARAIVTWPPDNRLDPRRLETATEPPR